MNNSSEDNKSPLLTMPDGRGSIGPSKRTFSVASRQSVSQPSSEILYDDISGDDKCVETDENRLTVTEIITEGWVVDTNAWWHYFTEQKWTDDGTSLLCAAFIFVVTLVLAVCKQTLTKYEHSFQWSVGFLCSGLLIVCTAHHLTNKPQRLLEYLGLFAISLAAAAIGSYKAMHEAGLSGSFWAIIIGMFLRFCGVNPSGVLTGEYFIKLGVTVYAVNLRALLVFLLPALVVGWVDTAFVMAAGIYMGTHWFGMDDKDAAVVAGGTAICGSSAAAAVSASVRSDPEDGSPPVADHACQSVIAIMGLLNTPLMPLLPLLYKPGGMHAYVTGGWIGGSIDSVGQVVASASLGGESVLLAATLVKMSQTIFIGPACLALTGIYKGTYSLRVLADRFPTFITGFFFVSLVVTVLTHQPCTKAVGKTFFDNLLVVSEWCSLMGFSRIGTQIDIRGFGKKKDESTIIKLYLCTQLFDLCTTLGWSYLMFKDVDYDDNASDKTIE